MIGIARRSVAIGTVVAAVLVLSAPTASATEVDDILERARSATYTATRLTVSVWADQTNVTRERVEHAAGAEMVRVDETWSMVGNGRTVVMGDAPEGIAFMTKGASVSTERYAIGEEAPCRHLRRQCSFIAITEGDRTRAKVLVAGDVMLDRYLFGSTGRISPEAPVPVVHVQQAEDRAGGAANVAVNLASLGVSTTLLGQ